MKAKITKEQLIEWRSKGYDYEKIGQLAGISTDAVSYYVGKYKLAARKRVTDQDRKQFCEMYQDGYTAERTAELTGFAYSTVYNVLKAAGLISDRRTKFTEVKRDDEENAILTPQILIFAKQKQKREIRTVIHGKRWIDVSDYYIPG